MGRKALWSNKSPRVNSLRAFLTIIAFSARDIFAVLADLSVEVLTRRSQPKLGKGWTADSGNDHPRGCRLGMPSAARKKRAESNKHHVHPSDYQYLSIGVLAGWRWHVQAVSAARLTSGGPSRILNANGPSPAAASQCISAGLRRSRVSRIRHFVFQPRLGKIKERGGERADMFSPPDIIDMLLRRCTTSPALIDNTLLF